MTRKTIGVLGQYGWIPDQMPHELPENAFSDVLDVRFKDGELQTMPGQKRVFTEDPAVIPYFVQSFTTSTLRYWMIAGLARVYVNSGSTYTDITPASPFTGTADNKWTGGAINGFPVLNNGVEQPCYWDPSSLANKLTTLPGWDTNERCTWLRTFKDFIFAGGITKSGVSYPNLFKWSDRALPGAVPASWDETDVTKDAGEQPITGNDGLIVDGLQMGDAFIVYFERGMVAVRESFDTKIFTFQRLPGSEGAMAINCVADTPVGHIVLTAGDVVLHAGQGTKSIAESRIKKWLFATMDATYRKRSFVVHNPRFKEVWVCFPTVGNSVPNMAAVYSYASDNWSKRELPNVTCGGTGLVDFSQAASWSSASEPWDVTSGTWDGSEFPPNETCLLLGTTSPKLDMADVGGLMSGSAFYPYARRAGLAVEEPWKFKLFSTLTPRIKTTVGTQVQISLGSQQVAERGESFSAVIAYTVGTTEPEACGLSQSGRFLAWEARSLGPQQWSMKSIDLLYKVQGLH